MLKLIHAVEGPVRVGGSAEVAAPPAPLPAAPVRKPSLGWRLRQALWLLRNGSYFIPLLAWMARRVGLMVAYGELRALVLHHDADGNVVAVTDYGLLSRKVVTTAGVTFLAADMAGGASDINLFKFHGYGTGNTAEAAGDTALVTELTTQYAADNTRPTGSQSSSTNTYTTVGTLSPDATVTVQEHGLFSQAATGGGTLWDRSVFGGIALTGGADSLQTTYVATFPAGS